MRRAHGGFSFASVSPYSVLQIDDFLGQLLGQLVNWAS